MRKLLAALLVLLCALPVAAGQDYWTVMLDNQPLAGELPPIPVDSHTLLVSARSLSQALKASYELDPASGQIRITRNGSVVEMSENQPQAKANGRWVTMPVAARRESGTMMIPVPFVAELLGYRAMLDAGAKTLSLTSDHSTASASPPLVDPAASSRSAAGSAPLPSALPWLASGSLPPGTFPAGQMPVTPVPQMPAGQGMQLPAMTSQPIPQLPPGSGSQFPTIGPSGATGYTLPASSGVQLPPGAYQTDMRVAPGERQKAPATLESPWMDNSVNSAGKMDILETDPIAEPEDPKETRPDPAITGLTLERRYDQFVNAYVVRYRVTNLGAQPIDKPMLVRLLVGGRGALQIMQDIRVDRLAPSQSLTFEWSGDARSHPALYDVVVRAQAKVVLDDQAADGAAGNNARTVRLSY